MNVSFEIAAVEGELVERTELGQRVRASRRRRDFARQERSREGALAGNVCFGEAALERCYLALVIREQLDEKQIFLLDE